MQLFICTHCEVYSHTSSLSLSNHRRKCKSNPNPCTFISKNGAIKAKERGEKLIVSDETRQRLSTNNGMHEYRHTDDFKESQRKRAIERELGGVRPSKRIKYNGVMLGSSYELEVVKSLDQNNISWNIPRRFKYIDSTGKLRTYTPDIYLMDYNVYLDPKNDYLLNNVNPSLGFTDREKIQWVMEQNNILVLILDKHNLNWKNIEKLL